MDTQDEQGNTPLHLIRSVEALEIAAETHLQDLRTLENKRGKTPLQYILRQSPEEDDPLRVKVLELQDQAEATP